MGDGAQACALCEAGSRRLRCCPSTRLCAARYTVDTCGPRTVDHGAMLAHGLFRLPAAAARAAPSADTGCAHTRVSRRHTTTTTTTTVAVVVIDDEDDVGIGTPTAATHGERDFLVFLALKKRFSRRPLFLVANTPHVVTCCSCPAPINQPLHFCCPFFPCYVILPTPPRVFHLSHRIAITSRTQREPRYLICIFLRYYIAEPPDSRRVVEIVLEKDYCTVCAR
jgi:hypothetical protein